MWLLSENVRCQRGELKGFEVKSRPILQDNVT